MIHDRNSLDVYDALSVFSFAWNLIQLDADFSSLLLSIRTKQINTDCKHKKTEIEATNYIYVCIDTSIICI